MRAIFTATIVIASLPLVLHATTDSITRLHFITDAQVIAPGQMSEVLTVQMQNVTGEEEKLDETADLTFTSSSPTGEFLGSTGNPVTTTMNKGSANRNFYYRDSTAGTHVLTITVRLRNSSGGGWSATQNITVNSGSTQTSNTTFIDNDKVTSTDSSHESQRELSDKELIELSTAGIGRDRSIPINVPIQFTLADAPQRGVYDWTFGDGTAGSGLNVRHIYQTEGDYVVILNGVVQGKEIVARTQVHVYTPSLMVLPSELPKTLVIKNTGDREVNIGGWFLESSGVEQRIPRDTILLPNAKIVLRMLVAPNIQSPISLYYPNRAMVARYDPDSMDTLREQMQMLRPVSMIAEPQTIKRIEMTTEEKVDPSSTSPRTLVLPLRRSWWQLFIDTVFAR